MNPEAKQIEEQINSKKSSFFSALDDFKKYYVYYNKNPEVQDYSTHYLNSKTQLQTLSSDVFEITSNIQRKIELKNKSMAAISGKLSSEKELNVKLTDTLKTLNGVKAGSSVMINDSKDEYILNYYKNVEIFIGIIILLALLVSKKVAVGILVIFIVYKSGILQTFIPLLGHIF